MRKSSSFKYVQLDIELVIECKFLLCVVHENRGNLYNFMESSIATAKIATIAKADMD